MHVLLTKMRVYLNVPFSKKDFAKSNKCFWDSNKKLWYKSVNVWYTIGDPDNEFGIEYDYDAYEELLIFDIVDVNLSGPLYSAPQEFYNVVKKEYKDLQRKWKSGETQKKRAEKEQERIKKEFEINKKLQASEVKIILIDDINTETDNYKEYYCANIKEKTFECSNKLRFVKGGGFGMNYRYCSSCYNKWDELDKDKKVNKYYNSKAKYANINFDSDSD